MWKKYNFQEGGNLIKPSLKAGMEVKFKAVYLFKLRKAGLCKNKNKQNNLTFLSEEFWAVVNKYFELIK